MTQEILRGQSFGLGIETTPGTAVAAAVSIPMEKFNIKHVLPKVADKSGFGVIDEQSDSHIVQETSLAEGEGIVRSQSIGYLLKLAMGTASATPTTVETGVYLHAFTRLNTNNHPTATVYRNSATQDERAPFHILESFEINAQVGEYLKFKTQLKGGKIESATYAPSYLTGTNDEQFKCVKAVIKIADDISGLAAASATELTGINLMIKKNSKGVFVLGSRTLAANHNQQFGVGGDITAMYKDNVLRDFATGNTKKAIQITVTGETLIGATKYNELVIQLAKASFEDWDRSDGLDDLMSQNFGFIGEYDFTNTQSMNITLQNVKSTGY